jgi:hypothetical protein
MSKRSYSVEVAYTLTLEDYIAFNLHLFKKTKMPRMPFQIALAIVLFLIGAGGLAASLMRGKDLVMTAVSVLILCSSTFPVTYPIWIAHQIRVYVKKLGTHGVTGPMRLILSDESLVEITETGRTEAKWRDMLGVEEIDSYTFIRITGLSACILPRAGFASEEEYTRVRDFATARAGRA